MDNTKFIKRILDDRNKNKFAGILITRRLSEKVQLAKIWAAPLSPDENIPPIQAYLVQKEKQYIGLVIEEDEGPYAFMRPAFRKKGFMSNALRQVILPHMLQQKPLLRLYLSAAKLGSDRQLNFAKKLALSVGFELLKEEPGSLRLVLDASRLKEHVFIKGENERLPKERLNALKKQIRYAASVLSMVQTELEYKRGISGYSEELGDWIKALFLHADKLEHAWFDKK